MFLTRLAGLALTGGFLTGCAHYYLPAAQLETSEVAGPDRIGRVELLGTQSAINLSDPGDLQESGKYKLKTSYAQPLFGFSRAFSEKIEGGLRIQPYTPPLFRIKYQLVGLPESQAERKGFSLAASLGGGLVFGSTTYILGSTGLHGGYRIWKKHLFSLSPFFRFASLSTPSLQGTGLIYGGSLGYQYDWAALGWRLDVAYAFGSFSSSTISGILPSLLLIWKI